MIKFLEKETVLRFQKDQILQYGGKEGLRDEGLLESALAQPKASFDGEYVHKDLHHMAAAYGYHLCKNHPFFDGNKRISLIAMYTFLHVNGYKIVADKKSLYAIIIDLAKGEVEKEELAEYLRKNSEERS